MNWLQKKEMGLPIWAWGIIAAVILFLAYRYFSNRSSGSSGSPAVVTGADTGSQDDSGVPGDSGIADTTPPPETQAPDIEQLPDNTSPVTDTTTPVLPHDKKQRTAVVAKKNTAALRNALKKALTPQPKNAKPKSKNIPKVTPGKPKAEKHAVKTAPVAIPQRHSPAAVQQPKKVAKPTPPKKVHK